MTPRATLEEKYQGLLYAAAPAPVWLSVRSLSDAERYTDGCSRAVQALQLGFEVLVYDDLLAAEAPLPATFRRGCYRRSQDSPQPPGVHQFRCTKSNNSCAGGPPSRRTTPAACATRQGRPATPRCAAWRSTRVAPQLAVG